MFYLVGERINTSREGVNQAVSERNTDYIQQDVQKQQAAGAAYIDINAGVRIGHETEDMQWLLEIIQEVVTVPVCIDSPDPRAIEAALALHKGTAMINSISLEKEREAALLPLLAGTDLKVVALCMSDEGMPETAASRLAIADKLVNRLVQNNIQVENIYVDPLVQPVSTMDAYGVEFLDAVQAIMTRFKGIHTICGLSNISFGLPLRPFLNQTFAVMAVAKGLDSVIINPLDKRMLGNLIAAETLAGRDNFCSNFLQAFRAKKFDHVA